MSIIGNIPLKTKVAKDQNKNRLRGVKGICGIFPQIQNDLPFHCDFGKDEGRGKIFTSYEDSIDVSLIPELAAKKCIRKNLPFNEEWDTHGTFGDKK